MVILSNRTNPVVQGQLIPILVYGTELHQHPTELMRRLARVEVLSGVGDLDTIIYNKRVRWAASVYCRKLPILREEAGRILREVLDPEAQLRWVEGVAGLPVEVEVVDLRSNARRSAPTAAGR